MKAIFCLKPCKIGGERFVAGQEIPPKRIAPGREKALMELRLIELKFQDAPMDARDKHRKTNR